MTTNNIEYSSSSNLAAELRQQELTRERQRRLAEEALTNSTFWAAAFFLDAAVARKISPFNSKIAEWCTSLSTAAIAVIGSLKNCVPF